MHLVDYASRYSTSCVIYTKRKEEIIKKIFQIWISIFGSAKKFLVNNGGEFDNDEFRPLCENVNIRIYTIPSIEEQDVKIFKYNCKSMPQDEQGKIVLCKLVKCEPDNKAEAKQV